MRISPSLRNGHLTCKIKHWIFAICLSGWATNGFASNCTVSSTSMAFGVYDASLGADLDSTADISITCDQKTQGTVSLSTGQSGNYSARQMMSGSTALNYNLYTNGRYRRIWGDGSSGTRTKSFNRRNKTYTVYGRIPGSQVNTVPGNYTDTVVITVDF